MSQFIERITKHFVLPFDNPIIIFGLLMFIALVVPILLSRIKIPGIIGLILSGIIIGPFGFKLIEDSSAIELFSKIGLLYIMFIAGLELDMNDFKANKNKSLIFGFFTFTIPLLIGFPLCHFILGLDFYASSLLAAMFATHTLVTYPIVSSLGIAKNKEVSIAVGGTIITDTAVLLALELILKGKEGAFNSAFLIELTLSVLVFSAIVFVAGPRIATWFFKKNEKDKYAHYIFVLFVVFCSAFLAELAGLEPILGAFAAGLALNKHIPHSSALMNRIGFIGNSLFIPIFFISVGMMINIKMAISDVKTVYIAMVLLVGAILGKWLAAYLTQLSFKLSSLQRDLIFGLSCAHVAATLAVVLVGYNAGILDEYALNATVILILATSLISSFVTQNVGRKIVIKRDSDQLSGDISDLVFPEKILIPIADLTSLEKHLKLATILREENSESPISILGVFPNDEEVENKILLYKEKLKEVTSTAKATDVKVNSIATIDYNVSSGISRVARETMSNLVILGWPRKHDLFDKLFGDMIEGTISQLDKNIIVCHLENQLILHKRIIVFAPPLCELEEGFHFWIAKVIKLAKELSIPVHLYCPRETFSFISQIKQTKGVFIHKEIENWIKFTKESPNIIKEADLIILISSKEGHISHHSVLDHMPNQMEKIFLNNSRLIIYPQ